MRAATDYVGLTTTRPGQKEKFRFGMVMAITK